MTQVIVHPKAFDDTTDQKIKEFQISQLDWRQKLSISCNENPYLARVSLAN